MTAESAREVVVARLRDLFMSWPAEQAVQFKGSWWAWGDVARVHTELEQYLRASDGPRAVAIVMRQRPELVAVELAVLATGCTAVLVTPLQSDAALIADVTALRPSVLIAHSSDWQRPGMSEDALATGALGLEVTDEFELRVVVPVTAIAHRTATGTTDAAVTVLTSGTTGPPKRLPVSWETFVGLGGGPDARPPLSGRGAVILSLPVVTLGGLLSMARLVFGGRPLSMMERFDVHEWAALVREHRPRVIGAPPPVVAMILDADISPDHFDGVSAFVTSSAAVAPSTAAAFEQRYGIPVLVGYGATEFLNSVTGWTGELYQRYGPAKLGSVGRALAGVRLRVIDPETEVVVAVDKPGLLEVDPPQRAGGLPEGWLRTNDRARIDSDGFVWILGRADDVINRGGFKIDLGDVEAALCLHPGVAEACAVGLPDDRLGQVPGAVVVVRGDAAPTEAELLLWLREHLAPYALPRVIRVVDTIPQTTTFKRHRAEVERLLR